MDKEKREIGKFHEVNRGLSTSRNSRRRSGGWADTSREVGVTYTLITRLVMLRNQ